MNNTSASISFKIENNPQPTSAEKRNELLIDPGFGTIFTDHMVVIHWSVDKGWHDAKITSRKPFEINPASAVLHYGQEIFEGLKAYRAKNGKVLLFRPEANAERFIKSAYRLSMPELPVETFIEATELLVKQDKDWIPDAQDSSLYIRPFMFANEAFLGVRPSREYIFCVIASPVASYFKGARKPVSVWLETEYSRAGPGGTGAAKCGGNYAASLLPQAEAYNQGCEQVLFLDVVENKWIEELGGMNICFVMNDNRLITPPLNGDILPGVTRNSILKLAKQLGLQVEEKKYSFDELKEDARSGKLQEVFACGTAAVVAAIGHFKYRGGETVIGNGNTGAVTEKIRDALVGLQRGEIEDTNDWVRSLNI